MPLEAYLTGDFQTDVRDIGEIEGLTGEVCRLFAHEFNAKVAWPYEVSLNDGDIRAGTTRGKKGAGPVREEAKASGISEGTTAMILASLIHALGYRRDPITGSTTDNTFWFPSARLGSDPDVDDLKAKVIVAVKLLFAALARELKQDRICHSGTFGDNDPLTMWWIAAVTAVAPNISDDLKGESERILAELATRSDAFLATSPVDPRSCFTFGKEDKKRALKHAFPVLRVVQILRSVGKPADTRLKDCFEYFETTLHDQLSYSAIPDSRFDPAELAFCLEGMLQCDRRSVDRPLLARVFGVLEAAQKESAFWRPVKPIFATEQGLTLFPVSVEVANSLMRSCFLADGGTLHQAFGTSALTLFRRYWQWLRARSIRFSKTDRRLVGWHSEHVNDPGVIHLWETSQVLEFLLQYRISLLRHVSRTTLVASQFSFEETKKLEEDAFSDDREPVTWLGDNYRAYRRIRHGLHQPPSGGPPRTVSTLLYGPPGTGKTTIAENIANSLGCRLIKITVSDFLAGGEAQMEGRAKQVFDVLRSQQLSVVLFDEIDNFLLNRESRRYNRQDTAFQFLTPGMLTKINDLRRSRRTVFVVATNYEERIDAAIKRTGRIDERLLILPPDVGGRQRLLKRMLRNDRDRKQLVTQWKLDDKPSEAWKDFNSESLFLSYADFSLAVKQLRHDASFSDLVEFLRKLEPTVSLEMYASRFIDQLESGSVAKVPIEEAPLEEFFCLAALYIETHGDLDRAGKHRKVIAAVRALFDLTEERGQFPIDQIQMRSSLTEERIQDLVPALGPQA